MKDKKYYEMFCKFILENKIKGMQNLQLFDSPDLQGQNIGIEVTNAIVANNAKIDSIYSKYINKNFTYISKAELKSCGFDITMEKLGGCLYCQTNRERIKLIYLKNKINEFILVGYIGKVDDVESCVSTIVNSIGGKLDKLNDHYKVFSENDLIVMINEQIDYLVESKTIISNIVSKVVDNLKILYSKGIYSYYFDKVYLLFLDKMICVNTLNWQFHIFDITQEDWNKFEYC